MRKDKKIAEKIVKKIFALAGNESYRFCHVCGTHEYTISMHGIRFLLKNVEVRAGPGCPVCITPAKDIDEAVFLAGRGVTLATFGDILRVRGTVKSLADVRAEGADVRIVYSPEDAVRIAKEGKDTVFFAIGFETTAPATASVILDEPPENFSMLVSHRLIPPAMELLVGAQQMGAGKIDGFICPGHVSTIIGTEAYSIFPEAYGIPTVISGFEALDVLTSILMLLLQIKERKPRVDNEYFRSVDREGNRRAKEIIGEVYEVVDGNWRGIGKIPSSALKLKGEFERYDARLRYDIDTPQGRELDPGCDCHLVLLGRIYPKECRLFGKICSPASPKGPCMVSREGTCNIVYKYERGARVITKQKL
jgi:hydrogenase expression/formation protein HypD